MPDQQPRSGPREDAQLRAFKLVHDIQADVPTALAELDELSASARARGWDEVARSGLLGRAVSAWLSRQPASSGYVAELVEESTGDQVMLALALAMRADEGFSGHNPSGSATRDADLARAVVMLERTDGRPLERISAHTACGIALLNRSLFELAAEQQRAALAVGPACPPEAVDFLLSPVVFNLAEGEMCWAAMLRQLGDRDGVAERCRAFVAAEAATSAYEMVANWRDELAAMGMLLMAMAGDDVSLEARRLLRRLRVEGRGDLRNASLLQLALALSDADAGRRAAARETEAAVAALDPEAQSHLYDLAIHLSAEIEAGFTGHSAGLRSARRHLEHHWAKRLSSLGAMRTLIRAERQSNEIEVLSRHARLDDLTGIGNRRALAEYLSNLERLEVERIALVVLDVDNFKFVNDNYGHLAGDSVLVGVARQLELGIRPTDLVVRLGGDEFAVLLADVDLETAFERALGLLHQVDRHSFDEVSPGLLATLSAGVAAGTPSALRDLWSEADAALYRAKGGGGQRVIRSRLAPASGRPSGSGVAAASNHLLRAHRHDDDLTRVEAR